MFYLKKIVYVAVAVWTVVACSLTYGQAAQAESIELYTVDYPPYTIMGQDGVFSGIDVDVVKAAFLAVGINVELKTAPWTRILKNIEHGHTLGTISCSKRPERLEYVIFSAPISAVKDVAVMAALADDQALAQVSDLEKFEVIAVNGWGVEQELSRLGIAHTTTPSIETGINAVINRGVDVFYNGELSTLFRARELGLLDKIKLKHFKDKMSTPLHICFSKQHSESQRLVERFNLGLSRIKDQGIYQAIYDKYL